MLVDGRARALVICRIQVIAKQLIAWKSSKLGKVELEVALSIAVAP